MDFSAFIHVLDPTKVKVLVSACCIVIKDSAGLDVGYCRELVFYKVGVNTHRTMLEFYTSDKVERETIICTPSYEDPDTKTQLANLKAGVEAARSLSEKGSRKSMFN
nr:hypothetical protein [Tanacetum cinerariifolium]